MLYSILEMLFRQRWRYLLLFVVLPLLGAALCVPLFPKSTAEMSVWVQDQTLLETTVPTYDAYLTPAEIVQSDMEQYVQTQTFSNQVKQTLVEKHGVSATEADQLSGSLATDLVPTAQGNNLLGVSYSCSTASLCPTVLNVAVETYETYSAATQSAQLVTAEKAFRAQVTQTQQQVDQTTSAVNQYLQAHPGESSSTSTDPSLTQLVQAQTTAEQGLQTAKGKLIALQQQASTDQLSAESLFSVVDAPHTTSSHLKSLPTKQMLIVASVFWALALLSLLLTARLSRVIRHPNVIESTLGIPLAAVMEPIPMPRRAKRLNGGAA